MPNCHHAQHCRQPAGRRPLRRKPAQPLGRSPGTDFAKHGKQPAYVRSAAPNANPCQPKSRSGTTFWPYCPGPQPHYLTIPTQTMNRKPTAARKQFLNNPNTIAPSIIRPVSTSRRPRPAATQAGFDHTRAAPTAEMQRCAPSADARRHRLPSLSPLQQTQARRLRTLLHRRPSDQPAAGRSPASAAASGQRGLRRRPALLKPQPPKPPGDGGNGANAKPPNATPGGSTMPAFLPTPAISSPRPTSPMPPP